MREKENTLKARRESNDHRSDPHGGWHGSVPAAVCFRLDCAAH
jgi:hypothetical protein